ncbi:glycosyl hydrolase family 43 [Clostridia bacterium]|nr:glycosyl hydrolase family 43 [Clostridia bacterium]
MSNLSEIQIRDPFVLAREGTYYLYGSTDKDIWKARGVGFDVYRSHGDLTEFEGPFPAFRPPRGFWSEKNFWAPEVYFYGGAFYMFATFLPVKGHRGTAVLRAYDPLGPFTPWSAGTVTPEDWECLDGTLYVEDGTPYMVFCHEWQQVGDGQICAVELSGNLDRAVGEPVLLFRAHDAPWTKPLPNRAPGSYVTDGPNLYRGKHGTLYMLWSSMTGGGRYALGVAASDNGRLAGPWRQADKPLYANDGGHGMLFTAPNGELTLAVHTPNDTPDERAVFVKVTEKEGGLFI